MIQEKALHIIKELLHSDAPEEFNYSFPVIDSSFDINEFIKQPCDLDGVDVEYVNQNGCADSGFYGQIAYKLFEDTFLVIGFQE